MDLSALAHLGPHELRTILIPFLAQYVADPDDAPAILGAMQACLDELSDEALTAMLAHMATLGEAYTLYAAEPTAARITRRWAELMLGTPEIEGLDHLVAAIDAGPTVILSNHQSYFDASVLDWALVAHGREDLAERFVVAAGPKVYSDLFRRFAAASLATIQVPQSTTLGHTEQMSSRELARRAIASMQAAREALESGRFLLVYPEGSRTRTGRMRSWLKAVYRYTELTECRVVPATILGADDVMPVGTMAMRPAQTRLSFGESFPVARKGGRDALPKAREAVIAMLPEALRPEADEPDFT